MTIYDTEEYVILAARLTPTELECINRCTQHGCVVNGECPLQDRVANILAVEREKVDENRNQKM